MGKYHLGERLAAGALALGVVGTSFMDAAHIVIDPRLAIIPLVGIFLGLRLKYTSGKFLDKNAWRVPEMHVFFIDRPEKLSMVKRKMQ